MNSTHRPPHRQWQFLVLVAAGGAIGSAARAAIALAFPDTVFPAATLTVNLLGAFGLGMLLEALSRFGDDTGRRRVLRLAGGTGFFGGFTTYSTFALETARLVDSALGIAVGYALMTVVIGTVATVLGVIAGAGIHHRRSQNGGAA